MEFHGQVKQDKWVCEFFNYKPNGFFIDIGAFDGIDFSNSYYLEKQLDWSGICIEASEKAFKKLVKNRNCICINKAVFKENVMVQFSECGMAGAISAAGNQPLTEALTLQSIFNKWKVPNVIDYISLDIEGGEYDALLGFPFNSHEVILWTIEHNAYLDRGILKEKIKSIMLQNEYEIAKENIHSEGSIFEDWYINKKYSYGLHTRG